MAKEQKKQHPNTVIRQMPHNFDAEKALLGTITSDMEVAAGFLPRLDVADFYSPSHKEIFKAQNELFISNTALDVVTLISRLETNGALDAAGGAQYIAQLTDNVPSVANAEYYFEIVKKNSMLRKIINVAQRMADNAYSMDPEGTALASAEADLYSLSENGTVSSIEHVSAPLNRAIKDIKAREVDKESFRGIPTGFKYLNKLLGGGFQKSDLILIAARPGQGKTSLAMNFIANAAFAHARESLTKKHDPFKCMIFSLEMSCEQLAKRLICSEANVEMTKAADGLFNAQDWQKIFAAKQKLDGAKIFIDETPFINPAQILSKCRRLKHTEGLDMIMIDYLQLMGSGKKTENRQQEISEITRMLKIAAKELAVPVILLSQMSRDIERRQDKTPQMSDLRDSGAIEQDADIIIFLHRPDQNDEFVKLIVAKHRNGQTGEVELRWRSANVTFVDVDKSYAVSAMEKNIPPAAKRINSSDFNMDDIPER